MPDAGVLFVEPVGERGGAQVLGLTLMQGLAARGLRVALATLAPGPLAREARDRGIETFELVAHRTRHVIRTGLAIARLARIARRLGAGLVHVQGTKTLVYGGPAGRLAGARVIWHLYDPPPSPPTAIDRVAIRCPFDAALAITPGTAEAFEALMPGRKVTVVLPGLVDPCPRPLPCPPAPAESSDPLILSIGRLQGFKGYDILQDAAVRVLARRPDARFRVVGSTAFGLEPELPETLARRARSLGIADRFDLAGALPDAQVYQLLDRSAMLVHPAVREPFGLALLEAMAHARPVVAAAAAGPSLIVDPGRTGLLVPVGDPAALAGAILELLDDPARARAMGESGRARFLERFTAARMVDQVEALYAPLVGR